MPKQLWRTARREPAARQGQVWERKGTDEFWGGGLGVLAALVMHKSAVTPDWGIARPL